MGYKNKTHKNKNENIAFSSNTFLNLVFTVGFFNLLYIFLAGFPSLKNLGYLHVALFIYTFTCSFLFIYFLFKILLLEIFTKKESDNLINFM